MSDIVARRWIFLYLVLASTVAALARLFGVLNSDGFSVNEAVIVFLFAILFAWIAASFWLSVFGAVAKICGANLLPLKPPSPEPSAARTAILMPIYNEDIARVFSGVRAMWEQAGPDYDFYILSDSTNPAAWVGEEMAWGQLKAELSADNLFYRHRARNAGRKAGNIQDFCENWGQLYDYMVILDADSLMTGRALNTLVGLMDANPRTGLIQAPPQLVGRSSLFARIQQFASSLHGPLHTAGLAWLQDADGNYWGHNAIIRVHAFMQCCALPRLPGSPPFGGEIMSHDFVEATLLRRAGWEVWMAPAIGGSFEEPPPTIADYLARDRRWCQGNLQHLRIVFARGLTLPSRLHLALGIMSYLASPLWLLLLLVSGIEMLHPAQAGGGHLSPLMAMVADAAQLFGLVIATLALLYIPKVLALLLALEDPNVTDAHGGAGALVASAVLESAFATLLAPVVMLQHSWYVVTIVLGISTGWNSQARDDRALPVAFVAKGFAAHTVIGIAVTVLLWDSGVFNWYLPLLAGLWLAIPLVLVTSSPLLGRLSRDWGLFLTPAEVRGLKVLDRAHALAASHQALAADARQLVLEDARVRALHLALLADVPAPQDRLRLWALCEQAARKDTSRFSRDDWVLLLSDAESIRALSSQVLSQPA